MKHRISISGRQAHDVVPVDKYIKYTERTFRDVKDPEAIDDDEPEVEREPYADEYVGGSVRITCIHCNTAFNCFAIESQTPRCPFCHKMPSE